MAYQFMGLAEGGSHMSEGKGRQFDPDIFECFLDRLEEFHNILGKVKDKEMPKALSIKEELERKNM